MGGRSAAPQDRQAPEPIFRSAIPIYIETHSADNIINGIARIKLCRTLLRQYGNASPLIVGLRPNASPPLTGLQGSSILDSKASRVRGDK